MNENNPKYRQLVRTAKDLFWKYGVKRVSIEEICRESSVSKMTFYKFFPNKIELATYIIKKEIGKSLKEFRVLIESEKSFQEKVHQIFVIKHDAARNISAEFINDLYKNPELGLHNIIEELAKKSMQVFMMFLEDSKSKGLIRKEVSLEFILAYQSSVSRMIEDKSLMLNYKRTEDFIMEAMNFLFYGIMPTEALKNA
jgi:AcrR family transcriptional regulator